jgi:nicotinamide-nucleotide amidase
MKELHLLGLPESDVNRGLEGVASPDGNPRLSLMVGDAVVTARFVATARTPAAARRLLADPVARARRLFRTWIYGEDGESPAEALMRLLAKRKLTLALAESCTGGLIGHLLTEVPGMSAHLREGCVTYSNEAKVRRLRVPSATIRRFGAVSAETAAAMAEGALRTSRAGAALAVTGIAGPGGGTREKPVGLVFVAARVAGRTTVRELRLAGTRTMIKARAARLAIGELIGRLR